MPPNPRAPSSRQPTTAELAAIFDAYLDGDLTDAEAADQADAALDHADDWPTDAASAYWTGRLEEATGRQLWPLAVRDVDA